jgi:hypothetical protein
VRYQNLTITPVFDMEAGAFSRYDPATNTLYLGDGEQVLFHLQVFWQSVNGANVDNKETKDGGHISLAKESGTSDSGEPLWRLGHKLDHLSQGVFYLIIKDLFYTAYSTRTTYKKYGDNYVKDTDTVTENGASYSAAQGQGITEWWVDVH